jgi:peptidoglycan hydrolase FlgJ
MELSDIPSTYAQQNLTFASMQRLAITPGAGQNANDDARLRQATRDFEALLIKQMLDSMRKTVRKSGLIDGGFAESVYEDMLYDEYAQKMAATSRFGLADMLYNQMSSYL